MHIYSRVQHEPLSARLLLKQTYSTHAMAKKPSTIDKFRELQQHAEDARLAARDEILLKAKKILTELKQLGFTYQLIEHKGGKRVGAMSFCPVCRFETIPQHDGRTHRFQGDEKKPLTRYELRKLGFQKVAE